MANYAVTVAGEAAAIVTADCFDISDSGALVFYVNAPEDYRHRDNNDVAVAAFRNWDMVQPQPAVT